MKESQTLLYSGLDTENGSVLLAWSLQRFASNNYEWLAVALGTIKSRNEALKYHGVKTAQYKTADTFSKPGCRGE